MLFFEVCIIIFSILSLSIANGSQIWNGNFDYYANSQAMDLWSWDNQVGEYQTYIYGGNQISDWVTLDPSFKNPSDLVSNQGCRLVINGSAIWEQGGSQLRRCELIPEGFTDSQQTGTLFYQWSMKQTSIQQLHPQYEHQLVFFESHFADIKYGGIGGSNLYLFINNKIVWATSFQSDIWYNFALEVNYNSNQVSLFSSTGSNLLTQVVSPISTTTSQSDLHIGHLRLPITMNGNSEYQDPTEEWLFYSTISIQNQLYQPFSSSSSSSSTSSKLPITSSKMSITSSKIPITSSKLSITSSKIPITSSKLSITSSKLPITSSRMTITSSKLPITSSKLPITSSKSPITSSNIIGTTGLSNKPLTTSISQSQLTSTSGSGSQSSCSQIGQMMCASSNTYRTCSQQSNGIGYGPVQSCQSGLTCHQSGIYIYCY